MKLRLVISDASIEESLAVLEAVVAVAEPNGACANQVNAAIGRIINATLWDLRADQLERLVPLLPPSVQRRMQLIERN